MQLCKVILIHPILDQRNSVQNRGYTIYDPHHLNWTGQELCGCCFFFVILRSCFIFDLCCCVSTYFFIFLFCWVRMCAPIPIMKPMLWKFFSSSQKNADPAKEVTHLHIYYIFLLLVFFSFFLGSVCVSICCLWPSVGLRTRFDSQPHSAPIFAYLIFSPLPQKGAKKN